MNVKRMMSLITDRIFFKRKKCKNSGDQNKSDNYFSHGRLLLKSNYFPEGKNIFVKNNVCQQFVRVEIPETISFDHGKTFQNIYPGSNTSPGN